jgi:hypothetical protein
MVLIGTSQPTLKAIGRDFTLESSSPESRSADPQSPVAGPEPVLKSPSPESRSADP